MKSPRIAGFLFETCAARRGSGDARPVRRVQVQPWGASETLERLPAGRVVELEAPLGAAHVLGGTARRRRYPSPVSREFRVRCELMNDSARRFPCVQAR